MRLVFRSCLFWLLTIPPLALAQDAPYDHPLFTGPIQEISSPPVDIEHVSVDVAFDAVAQSIQVHATYYLTPTESPLDSLVFSAQELAFDTVALVRDSLTTPLRFAIGNSDQMVVYFDSVALSSKSFALTLAYTASPKRGVLFKPTTERDWEETGGVLTQNIPGTTSYWLPTLGNPFTRVTSELSLSIPDTWEALGPGHVVQDTTVASGTAMFASTLSHPIYQLGFAAGRYDTYIDHVVLPGNQYIALTYLVPPNTSEPLIRRSLSPIQAPLSWLATTLKTPFPASQFSLLIDSPVDEMAGIAGHAFFSSQDLVDQRAAADFPPDIALAKAIIPRWVGQLVSSESWFDSWLESGLQAYLGVLYAAQTTSPEELPLGMTALRDRYLAEATRYRRPLIWDQWTDPYFLRDQHNTARGAWVYHLLHERLGDDVFWQCLQRFLQKDAVDTNDLQAAAESVAEKSLGDFFDQWVYAAGMPELDLSYHYNASAATLDVTIMQNQSGYLVPDAFHLDLTLEVNTLFETREVALLLTDRTQTVSIPLDTEPRYVVLDPSDRYLKTISLTQTANAWVAQLRNASTFTGRLQAVQALGDFATDSGVFIGLRNAFDDTNSDALRAAITTAIAQRPPGNAEERLLLRALDDPAAEVRLAALRGLASYEASLEVPSRIRLFAEFDPSYKVQAQAVAIFAQFAADDVVPLVRSALVTPSHQDIIRQTALASLAIPAIEPIDRAEWSKPYYALEHTTATRQAALAQIAPYASPSRRLQNALLALLNDPAPSIRIAAISATQHVPRNRRMLALRQRLAEERHPAVRSALETALNGDDSISH